MTSRNRAVALVCGLSTLVGAWSGGPVFAQRPAAEDKKPVAAEVEAVLRKTTDFYRRVSSLAVQIEQARKLGPKSLNSTHAIDFVRPNKLAIRSKGNISGIIDVVCDGKIFTISIVELKKYIQSEASVSLEVPKSDVTSMGIILAMTSPVSGMLAKLLSAEPYKSLMREVETSAYVGKEPLNGVTTHHLKLTQDESDWELWIAADGDPLLLKTVMDMTKSMARSPAAAQFKGQKVEITNTYKGWKINQPLGKDAFIFQPPEGSKKFDSLQELFRGSGGNAKAASPLVGKPAPAISLKRLDKGEFRLADHRDKEIVILDFWATWCGPCVQELPILAEVADAYKGKGVSFIGIDLMETPEEIKKFQEEKKLKFNVALDSEGKVGTDYNAQAIPMLVLIDKKGIVRAVHVGYNPSIKTTLGKELDALIAGKEIPKPVANEEIPKPAIEPATETAKTPEPPSEGLKRLWSVSGAYNGVAADAKGKAIYALQLPNTCNVLDAGGKVIRGFAIGGRNQANLRVARRGAAGDGLLAFESWGQSVLAVKSDGAKAWEETGGQGIDDVWAADLDGDGVDETIVGYNGLTGLHVFSSEGKRLWKRTEIGNVWHVTAGDVDGDGKPEVITTSAAGKVHLFAAEDGKPLKQLDPGLYANMVRVAPGQARPPANGDLILVGGMEGVGQGVSIIALGGDGKVQWTTPLPNGVQSCDSMAVTPDGKWAAVGLRGGRVCVIDVASGKVVGSTVGQGFRPEVAWAVRSDGAGPQLLVTTGSAVNAFAIIKPDAASGEAKSATSSPR